jgi:hypothetical protein
LNDLLQETKITRKRGVYRIKMIDRGKRNNFFYLQIEEVGMKRLRKQSVIFCVFSTVLMVLMSVPFQPVLAALISTETVPDYGQAQEARDYLKQILAREDVRAVFLARGINPQEAQGRMESMMDAEFIQLAGRIEDLPAGGRGIGFVLGCCSLFCWL